MQTKQAPRFGWQPVERAAFGLIYGAIMVLSLLLALGDTPEAPLKPGLVLFGSMLAVTLTRAFAELLSNGMETGERILTRRAFSTVWSHSHPTLTVATVPTLLFLAAGLGWLTIDLATSLSQAFCLMILIVFGARVGWVVKHSWRLSVGGAFFAGGVGCALAVLKYAIR